MSDSSQRNNEFSADRRRVLLGMGVAGAAIAGSALSCPAMAAAQAQVTQAPSSDKTQDHHDFHGKHQTGIVTPRPAAGMLVAFDVLASDRKELERLFRTLNERIAFLMSGGAVKQVDPKLPPLDSGILGPVVTPDNLTITVSVGNSLFDERFGLESVKPKRLIQMVGFPNDALQPDLCHGDLSIQFCANTPDTNIHALRDIVKNTPDLLLVRWKQEGSVPPQAPTKPGEPAQSARNFLGFRDGSANPDSNDTSAMDRIVLSSGFRPVATSRPGPPMAVTRPCGSSATWSNAGTVPRCRSRKASSAGRKPPEPLSAARPKPKCRTTARIRKANGSDSTPTSAWPTHVPPKPSAT